MFYSLRKRQLVLLFVLGFVLLQYQNCSSVPGHLLDSNVAFAGDGSMKRADMNDDGSQRVGVINPISVGAISFPQAEVSVEDQSLPLVLLGVCEQNGSLIGWNLYKGETLMERGLAQCDLGSFEITVDQQWQDHCGEETLRLSAALGAKASAKLEISVPCSSSSQDSSEEDLSDSE